MPKSSPNRRKEPPPLRSATRSADEPFETVDPAWILKAGAAVVLAALLCAYILLCVVFSRTQWQFVLHPSRTVSTGPASLGLTFTEVHFGVDATGQPQLDGWWIPSDLPTDPTVLMLHSGDGSISDALAQARLLHDTRLNVLLFDYRGFGRSGGQHPTEALMQADASSGLAYLTGTRNIPVSSIIVYGQGAGASLAAKLCTEHKDIAALILNAPDGDFDSRVQGDPRAKLVPVRLLFHQHFPLSAPLQTLATPKLILTYSNNSLAFNSQTIAAPKITVEIKSPTDTFNQSEALRRFLDSYVSQPPASLTPIP